MPRSWIQPFAILVFAITLFALWDFSQRAMTAWRLSQAEQQLEQKIQRAQATQAALVEKKKIVQSDACVEMTARVNWHWVRANDKLVLPLTTPTAASSPAFIAPCQPSEIDTDARPSEFPAPAAPEKNWLELVLEWLNLSP